MGPEMLELKDFGVSYGSVEAVKGLNLTLRPGEALGLTGRNGAGKTSTIKGLMGLVDAEGKVLFKGKNIADIETHRRVGMGIGYMPQEVKVFSQLTLGENLRLAMDGDDVLGVRRFLYELFPELKGRFNQKAGTLSGGEQSMVAVARLLISSPELMVLDEPTEGLMPEIEDRLFHVLKKPLNQNRSLLIASQNLDFLNSLSSRIYLLDRDDVTEVTGNK